MHKFLETHNLPKLIQEKSEHLNRPITTNKIEVGIKNSQQTKILDWMASQVQDWLPIIQRRTNTYPPQIMPKNSRGGKTPSSFYEASITLIPKPDKEL